MTKRKTAETKGRGAVTDAIRLALRAIPDDELQDMRLREFLKRLDSRGLDDGRYLYTRASAMLCAEKRKRAYDAEEEVIGEHGVVGDAGQRVGEKTSGFAKLAAVAQELVLLCGSIEKAHKFLDNNAEFLTSVSNDENISGKYGDK